MSFKNIESKSMSSLDKYLQKRKLQNLKHFNKGIHKRNKNYLVKLQEKNILKNTIQSQFSKI